MLKSLDLEKFELVPPSPTNQTSPVQNAPEDASILWAVIVGAVLSLLSAFGWGANGFANCFALLVNSGAMSMRRAKVFAVTFQLAATLYVCFVTSFTSTHVRPRPRPEQEAVLSTITAHLSVITSTTVWVWYCTSRSIPLSSTQCAVAGYIGFILTVRGIDALRWELLSKVLASFVATPFICGLLALYIYYLLDLSLMRKKCDRQRLCTVLGVLFMTASTLGVVELLNGLSLDFHMERISFMVSAWASSVMGLISVLLLWFFVEPMLQVHVDYEVDQMRKVTEQADRSFRIMRFRVKKLNVQPKRCMVSMDGQTPIVNRIKPRGFKKFMDAITRALKKHYIKRDFAFLHDLYKYSFGAALFFIGSFAAILQSVGSIRNAAVPLHVLIQIYRKEDIKSVTPLSPMISLFLCPAICLGILYWGHKVVRRLKGLSAIQTVNGSCAQLATSIITVVAGQCDMTYSSTYCLLASMMFVGFAESNNKINTNTLKTVVIFSLITMPVLIVSSGALSFVLRLVI